MAQDNNATFRFSPALHVPLTFRFEGMSQFHVKACSVQTPFMSFGGLLTKDEATSLVALLLRFPTFPGVWSHARNSHFGNPFSPLLRVKESGRSSAARCWAKR